MTWVASRLHNDETTGLMARLRSLGRCRLCLRITLALFASILAVEALILVPSYRNQERALLMLDRWAAAIAARDGERRWRSEGLLLFRVGLFGR